jgi:hypothetical protein
MPRDLTVHAVNKSTSFGRRNAACGTRRSPVFLHSDTPPALPDRILPGPEERLGQLPHELQ